MVLRSVFQFINGEGPEETEVRGVPVSRQQLEQEALSLLTLERMGFTLDEAMNILDGSNIVPLPEVKKAA